MEPHNHNPYKSKRFSLGAPSTSTPARSAQVAVHASHTAPAVSAAARRRQINTTPSKPKRLNETEKQRPSGHPHTITPVKNPYLKTSSTPSTPSFTPKRSIDFSKSNTNGTPPNRRKISSTSTTSYTSYKYTQAASTASVNLSTCFDIDDNNPVIIYPNKTYTLYFDGGSRGNPGISGAGMVIYDDDDEKNEIWKGKQFIGDKNTNNEAEYIGLVTGLECAVRLGIKRIFVKGDSKLIVNQVLGKFNCNAIHLRQLLQNVLDVIKKFKSFDITHVYRKDNKRADELANAAMDDKITDLGIASLPKIPSMSREECLLGTDNNKFEVKSGQDSDGEAGKNAEEELCSLICSQSIGDDNNMLGVDDANWMLELPFLVQFELERFNMRKDPGFNVRLKEVFDANKGRRCFIRELISFIYKEKETPSNAPYDDLLTVCSNNGSPVDEADSCLFHFNAKLTEKGIELISPDISGVMTRRIHRKFGSHRFLDLRCDEKCTASLPVLKKHLNNHLKNNKLVLSGRQYGILYSNPSEKTIIFRLFAESGIGIEKHDEISAAQVAAQCIPTSLNPGLSLTRYMKRMKLSFTTTIPSFILKMGMLEEIPDIKAIGIMTDGCGLISRGALNEVYNEYTYNQDRRNISIGKTISVNSAKVSCPFSSFQGRIGGIKGMFVVDDSLDGIKVQYRPSQLKYHVPITKSVVSSDDGDEILHNTIEVKEWDKPPPPAHLNQNIIQLLEATGVPKEYFLDLAEKEVGELRSLREDRELLMQTYKARKYVRDCEGLFENEDILMRMLHARVPLGEPVMISKTNDFVNEQLKRYRGKSKFPVRESRYLRMLPDHTGLLKSNEVFIAIGDEGAQYEVEGAGEVVAMRLPSYFESDMQKFKVVSKTALMLRCSVKGGFFSGIRAALVLSTKGDKSKAETMSGGDFDGDKAWCCWNEIIVRNAKVCPEENTEYQQPCDPFKERPMAFADPEWTNLIINYTMRHRNDKNNLGKLANTLQVIRDSRRFSHNEVNEVARKAFVQVDNPHISQWNDNDEKKYGGLSRPHWYNSARSGNTYQSNRSLGLLNDLLNETGNKVISVHDIEPEMNIHIRERIERACTKDIKEVEMIREDMQRRLSSFNDAMKEKLDSSCRKDENFSTQITQRLLKQYRLDIEESYQIDDLPKIFAILYEQTYFKSRERMCRWNKKPYIFAWGVAHDHLTRIIADGDAKKCGVGIAPTIARGDEQIIFGKKR